MDDEILSTPDVPRSANESAGGFPQRVFLKKTGLRTGWRFLIYTAIFFVVWNASGLLINLVLQPARNVFSLAAQFLAESASFLSAFSAAWIMSLVEQRPLSSYGLPARGSFGKLFWQGCAFGLIEISGLIGIIAAFGGYSFGSLAEHGGSLARWALFFSAFFMVVAFFEEFLFRGYTLHTLAEGIGFWPAAILMSVIFGAIHLSNPGEDWKGGLGVVLVGLFWSFTLKRTGSLWFAVGMHAAFDFGETFLFSVPDSGMVLPGHLSNATLQGPSWITGGAPGPEASVFDFLILLVFFVVVHFLYPAKATPQMSVATNQNV
jgi:membrane protease YdiL (CAAX protease family)